jgi:hypothetical protein
MATEGVEAAMSLEADMFPDNGGAPWALEANRIHGADRMIALFEDAFPVDLMSGGGGGAGHRLLHRRARDRASPPPRSRGGAPSSSRGWRSWPMTPSARRSEEDPRIDLLTDFIEANDLVERNVSGALNSNFAFYRGLSDGGAFEVEIPEELMLAEVWGQEPELRRDTIEWLYSFQLSAYAGLRMPISRPIRRFRRPSRGR